MPTINPIHQMEFRVAYADTDRMGVVYYANYLMLYERGRTELMRTVGLRYRELEEAGVFLPALEAHLKYLAPARYDDLILIKTAISELGRASITFGYELSNRETGNILSRGSTKHPFVNSSWKPVAVPLPLAKILKPLVVPGFPGTR